MTIDRQRIKYIIALLCVCVCVILVLAALSNHRGEDTVARVNGVVLNKEGLDKLMMENREYFYSIKGEREREKILVNLWIDDVLFKEHGRDVEDVTPRVTPRTLEDRKGDAWAFAQHDLNMAKAAVEEKGRCTTSLPPNFGEALKSGYLRIIDSRL